MRKLILAFCLIIVSDSFSQQLPQFTQFSNNISLVNNANFVNDENSANFGVRSQMLGFGLEPNTAFFFGNCRLQKKPKPNYNPHFRISRPIPVDSAKKTLFRHAISLIAHMDRYGAFGRTQISGVYSIGYKLKNELDINAGLKVGYANLRFNQADAVVLNPLNPYSAYAGGDTEYDDYIAVNPRVGNLDLGASLLLTYKKFRLGISADQLGANVLTLHGSKSNFNSKVHAALLLGYYFQTERKLKMEFFSLIKNMSPAPVSVDFSVRASLPNGIWFGANYRNQSSVGLMGGCMLKNSFRIGYSYDIITTKLNSFSNGGHEILIGYVF